MSTPEPDRSDDEMTPSEQVERMLKTNSNVQHRVEHLSKRAIKRGEEAREFHRKLGHPSDAVLGPGLDSGCYRETDLTSADLRVARMTLGQCDACVEGKMTAPAEPTSHRWHDTGVGDTMYYDILPLKHETIGGNR